MSVKVTPSKIVNSDLSYKDLKYIKMNFIVIKVSRAGTAIFTGMDIKGKQ
jgi:hypothetical protein